MVVERVLESGGEMHFSGADLWESVEEVLWQRGGAVLHRTGEAALARQLPESLKHAKVEHNFGNAATRKWHATVARPRLHGDLAQAARARSQPRKLGIKAIQICSKLLNGGVVRPNFANLTADADLNTARLNGANQRRRLSAPLNVDALLLDNGCLREVNQGGGINVDVAVSSINGEPAGARDLCGDRIRVGDVLLRNELIVVPLNEEWATPASGDRGGINAGGVVDWTLEGVGLLRAGELKDQRRAAHLRSALERSARHVEDL